MKKILSVFLCIAVLLGLASCGKSDSETPSVSSKESSVSDSSDNLSGTNADLSTDLSVNTSNETDLVLDSSKADVNSSSSSSANPSGETTSVEAKSTVKVTIPEGYTLLRISWLLEEKGLCKSDDFVNAAQTAKEWLDLNEYYFLKDAFNAKNVCFYLEGYIFPLTYEIPKNSDAKTILKMLLNGTKNRFTSELVLRAQNSGHTLHEILTIASIIEKEARTDEQRTMVASVLYNRLKAKMPFQCDVCINYCEGVIKIAYPNKFTALKEYYNGKNAGMLAGPICNPGMASINAAINPAKTDYLYFIIGKVPPYEAHYSKTYEEHDAFWQANKDRLTGK